MNRHSKRNYIQNNQDKEKEKQIIQSINKVIDSCEKYDMKTSIIRNSHLEKLIKLNDLILTLKGSNKITDNLYYKIKQNAISSGGFLNFENRKIIWKKIFQIKIERQNSNLKELELEPEPEIKSYMERKNYDDIINKDVNRSVIHHFKNENDESIFSEKEKIFITTRLSRYLKHLFETEKGHKANSYDYYQGFHDISLFPMLLYLDDTPTLRSITDNMINIYLIDYMQDNHKGVFVNVAKILNETVNIINKEIAGEIESNSSEAIYFTCISWVICLFTQNFKDITRMYRLLDYIFCSHPIMIYIIAAIVNLCQSFTLYRLS